MSEMRLLFVGIIVAAGLFGLLHGINYLSLVAAQYFNNHTAIQFLEWMYRV